MYSLSYIKYEEEDFDQYYLLVKHDAVMQYVTGKAPTLEESKIRFERIIKTNKEFNGLGYFKVYDSRQYIGLAKFAYYQDEKDFIEIGYLLFEDFWGLGYGSTICKDLISNAKQTDFAKELIALIDPENIASRKILTNHGFESFFLGEENNQPTEKLKLKL